MSDSLVQYLFVAQLLIGLMLAVSLLIAWLTVDRKPHALIWSLGFFVATANGVLNALNELFSSRELYWLIVSFLSLTMATLAYVGFRKRAGLPLRVRWLVLAAMAVELMVAWFTIAQHHMGMRMFLAPTYFAVMMVLSVVVLVRAKEVRVVERTTALIVGGFAVAKLASGVTALLQGAEPDERYLNVYQRITFLTMPAFYAAFGIAVVLLLADDLSARMRRLAVTDILTGLLNRRGFEEVGRREVGRAHRYGGSLGVAVLDLDHFKAVNDRFGHAVGDDALRRVATVLLQTTRSTDFVARIGGEEFVILMPNTESSGVRELADRLREEIAGLEVNGRSLTVSIGVAVLAPGERLWDFLSRTDRALYRAKGLGRDRVESAEHLGLDPASALAGTI